MFCTCAIVTRFDTLKALARGLKMHLWRIILLCLLGYAAPASACEKFAQTPLEQAFCKIKALRPELLPYNLNDFRKNPAKTQWFLLTRPAKAAGVVLPPAPKAPSIVEPKIAEPATPKPTAQTSSAKTKSAAHGAEASPYESTLTDCSLKGEYIECADGRYQLLDNLPNNLLEPGALDKPFSLPSYTGAAGDVEAHRSYVAACYKAYVLHMVSFGLAASTMSYTKFYHTQAEVRGLGADFSSRLVTMFDYLKRDKATIGVKRRYTDALPSGIEQCARISAQVLVCDDVKTNWVYQRTNTKNVSG